MQDLQIHSLAECEAIIEKGLQTFIEVGNALLTIREKRLYKETFSTFEDYCRERWGFRREVADRYVRAAEVVTAINPIGLPAPRSEAVARELAPLRSEPEKAREAWAEAVEKHGPQPTAKQVREVVRGDDDEALVEEVAAAVGFSSGLEYEHAKKVIEAAEAGDPLAVSLQEEMDRTGDVEGAYHRLAAPARSAHRTPITDGVRSLVVDLARVERRLVKLGGDDRLAANRKGLREAYLNDLLRFRETLTEVINQVEGRA